MKIFPVIRSLLLGTAKVPIENTITRMHPAMYGTGTDTEKIRALLDRIRIQFESVSSGQGGIPGIESELLLNDLAELNTLTESWLRNLCNGSQEPQAKTSNHYPENNALSRETEDPGESYIMARARFLEPTTINDAMGESQQPSLEEKLRNLPVSDLSKAIGVNEKFIFMNELFEGNSGDYHQTIDKLNGFKTFEQANAFLMETSSKKFNWNLKNKFVRLDFLDLLQRRYPNA